MLRDPLHMVSVSKCVKIQRFQFGENYYLWWFKIAITNLPIENGDIPVVVVCLIVSWDSWLCTYIQWIPMIKHHGLM